MFSSFRLNTISAGGAVAVANGFIASASSTTSTITIPSTAAAGQLAILFDFAYQSSTTFPSFTTPTGFTSNDTQGNASGNAVFCRVSYKKLVAGDPGSTITGMTGSSGTAKTLLIYQFTAINAIANAARTASSSPSASTTLNLSGLTAPLLGYAVFNDSGTVPTPTNVSTATRSFTVGTKQRVYIWEALTSNTFSSYAVSATNNINSVTLASPLVIT